MNPGIEPDYKEATNILTAYLIPYNGNIYDSNAIQVDSQQNRRLPEPE
ncbi:MAG: hypothetical protein AABY47_01855 [Pseudomonadota bacterium]